MPSLSLWDYWYITSRKHKVSKCKYCKGRNLKTASHGNFCCDCRKTSNYFEYED